MRAGGDGGVCGPGEACTAGCAGQGRQWRVRPALIEVGGCAWATGRRAAQDGTTARKKRERERESEVRSAKKKRWNRRMESDVGNRVLGTEKRFSGVRVQVLGGFELNNFFFEN